MGRVSQRNIEPGNPRPLNLQINIQPPGRVAQVGFGGLAVVGFDGLVDGVVFLPGPVSRTAAKRAATLSSATSSSMM